MNDVQEIMNKNAAPWQQLKRKDKMGEAVLDSMSPTMYMYKKFTYMNIIEVTTIVISSIYVHLVLHDCYTMLKIRALFRQKKNKKKMPRTSSYYKENMYIPHIGLLGVDQILEGKPIDRRQ